MRNVKIATLMLSVLAAGAFAGGLYFDVSTGLAYSDFEITDKPYYVSKTDPSITYSKEHENAVKVEGDRQRFQGFGPSIDVKFGYGWQYGALFTDIGFAMGYGSHEGDDYFVDKGCGESNMEDCLGHDEYEYRESSSDRFFAGAGFVIFPFGGTESMSRFGGLHFGASFGFSLVQTATDDDARHDYQAPLSDMGLGLQVELGQKWLIAGRWDTGFSVSGSWDFPDHYEEGFTPEDYFTIGVAIHVSRR